MAEFSENSNALLIMARMMIKQAKMLRDAGLVEEAGELAKRALRIDHDGWRINALKPIPIRSETYGRRAGRH